MSNVRCAVQAQNEHGQTPLWCPRTNAVCWLDIGRPKLQTFDPAAGRRQSFSFPCAFLGSLALRRAGGFLLALDLGLHTFDPATGELAHFCDVETGPWNNRLNDGRCDAHGRLWIGTM